MMNRFKYAFQGVLTLLRKDRNFLYHLILAVLIIILGSFLSLNRIEWMLILLAIFLVLITETINTAIEYAVDLTTGSFHIFAKNAKDISAFSVLLASIFAIIIGCMIFIPKLI